MSARQLARGAAPACARARWVLRRVMVLSHDLLFSLLELWVNGGLYSDEGVVISIVFIKSV